MTKPSASTPLQDEEFKGSSRLSTEARAAISSGISATALGIGLSFATAFLFVTIEPFNRFRTTDWMKFLVEVREDAGWVLPSLLAVVIGLYAALFGESIGRIGALQESTRLRIGLGGTMVAGVAFFYVFGAAATALTGNDAPKSIGVLVIGVAIYVLGLGVGSFSFGSTRRRLDIAKDDLDRARQNLRWQRHISNRSLSHRSAKIRIASWTGAPLLIGLAAVPALVYFPQLVLADILLPVGPSIGIISFGFFGAVLLATQLRGTMPRALIGILVCVPLLFPAVILLASVSLTRSQDPAVIWTGWGLIAASALMALLWVLPLFVHRSRWTSWMPGTAAMVVSRRSSLKSVQANIRRVARVNQEIARELADALPPPLGPPSGTHSSPRSSTRLLEGSQPPTTPPRSATRKIPDE